MHDENFQVTNERSVYNEIDPDTLCYNDNVKKYDSMVAYE